MAYTNYLITQLQQQGLYRLVFLAVNGDWPHPCYFCGEEVNGYLASRDKQAAVIHHLDHDDTNHAPENLVAAHHGCHTTYHKKHYWSDPERRARQSALSRGRKPNEETRRKMRAAQKERFKRDGPNVPSAEGRAKISKAKTGHLVSTEQRAKQSVAMTGRKDSPETRAKKSAASLGKPKSATHRANIAAARRGKPAPNRGYSKLTPQKQAEVYARCQTGETQTTLAAKYNVSQGYISKLIRRVAKTE